MLKSPMMTLFCLIAFSFSAALPAGAADEGARIFADSCLSCHNATVRPLDNKHMTREEWKETVDRMLDQGAEVAKGKIPVLLDYLASTRGPVNTVKK